MKADAYDLRKVFGFDHQLCAPLFQRPYVWNQENQWELLWSDIRILAEKLARGEDRLKPHFMGAVVLDQKRVVLGKPDSRWIIDGQQRLTTLQIFLAAFRDVCTDKGKYPRLSSAIGQLIFNSDPMAQSEEDRYKVWPTNLDRPAFRAVMTGGSPTEVKTLLKQANAFDHSLLVKCYLYFWETLSNWLLEEPSIEEKKLEALLHTFRERLKLVVIDMDDEDNAQVIFETLNARGTPLLPSDLVKNFLFHRAEEKGEVVGTLYERYWEPFDGDNRFWRSEVRQGRLRRPRIDLFLQHYLTLMNGDEVSASALFAEFQRFWERNDAKDPCWHLKNLWEHAAHFKRFFTLSAETRERMFFDRMQVMDITTVFPFLLGLYREFTRGQGDEKELTGILEDIESYLVRRMICKLTTKDYNHLFMDLLGRLRARKEYTRRAVAQFLGEQTADSRFWPDNERFRDAWLSEPIYKMLTRPRVRMVLKTLDDGLRSPKTESYSLKENLTVEHFMPQRWEDHWPIGALHQAEPVDRSTSIARRNVLVQTLGNLTLLTKALNPAVSNGPFEKKRDEILKHSAINLNRFLLEIQVWDEERILARGEQLLNVACKIWPPPPAKLS